MVTLENQVQFTGYWTENHQADEEIGQGEGYVLPQSFSRRGGWVKDAGEPPQTAWHQVSPTQKGDQKTSLGPNSYVEMGHQEWLSQSQTSSLWSTFPCEEFRGKKLINRTPCVQSLAPAGPEISRQPDFQILWDQKTLGNQESPSFSATTEHFETRTPSPGSQRSVQGLNFGSSVSRVSWETGTLAPVASRVSVVWGSDFWVSSNRWRIWHL